MDGLVTTAPCVIGITMGDPTGVGPEIIALALREGALDPRETLLIGDLGVFRRAFELVRSEFDLVLADEPTAEPSSVAVADIGMPKAATIPFGQIDACGGTAAARAITLSTELALHGRVDAVVSCPANKTALKLAGHNFLDSTDMYASLAGTPDYTLMLHGGLVYAFLTTTHVSLHEAIGALDVQLVARKMIVADQTLRRLGFAEPTIAVAGLNPHLGESGILGQEEIEILEPAVEEARASGVNAGGLVPAESVVPWSQEKRIDGVVCLYHDQATIALKPFGYSSYAVGLPFVRCAVGHGTAHDIAGTGTADPRVLVQTAGLARRLARQSIV